MHTPTTRGRPAATEGERLTARIFVLVEPSLADSLRAWASAHGMTASGATRQAIMEMLAREEKETTK